MAWNTPSASVVVPPATGESNSTDCYGIQWRVTKVSISGPDYLGALFG